MTVVSTLPPSPSTDVDRAIILKIFSSIGRCRFLDEKHFDACTALSGSGPAFACIFLEAMADGGVMMGLPRAEALELAAQSMLFHVCFDTRLIVKPRSYARYSSHGSPGWSSSSADQRHSHQYVDVSEPTRLSRSRLIIQRPEDVLLLACLQWKMDAFDRPSPALFRSLLNVPVSLASQAKSRLHRSKCTTHRVQTGTVCHGILTETIFIRGMGIDLRTFPDSEDTL